MFAIRRKMEKTSMEKHGPDRIILYARVPGLLAEADMPDIRDEMA